MDGSQNNIIVLLQQHQLWIDTVGKQGSKLMLDEEDMRSIDLKNYPLDQGYMTECMFHSMDLRDKDFHNSVLCSSKFISANLDGANFINLTYHIHIFQEQIVSYEVSEGGLL